MQMFKEAGLPDGVINFVPGAGSQIGKHVMSHSDLAGIHFTGSTGVFQTMWKTVGKNIEKYKHCQKHSYCNISTIQSLPIWLEPGN